MLARGQYAIGLGIGLAVGLLVLPPAFVLGNGGYWRHPDNDFNAYLAAWNYFIREPWRLPLMTLPAMGYPEGGSLLFNDAIPAASVPTKVLYRLTGYAVNPFGWWSLLCYTLQGAMAVRVARALGLFRWWSAAAAAILATGFLPFMLRLNHTAVSSHFLLLWALAVYLEDERRGRFSSLGHFGLFASTLLINAYILVMVTVLQTVTFVTLLLRGQIMPRTLLPIGASALAVLAIAWVLGYGEMFSGPAEMQAWGYGHYSWNAATLLTPREAWWHVPAFLVRDATGGQYEGESYLGLGGTLLLIAAIAGAPRRVVAGVRRHAVLCVALIALALFAASHRVYLGSWLLADVRLPDSVFELASLFRASGRFIWVPAYCLLLFSLAAVLRWLPRRAAAAVCLLAVGVQLRETVRTADDVRDRYATTPADLVDTAQLSAWVGAHQRVFQFPSWYCGGLHPNRGWETRESNQELQIQLVAARAGRPTNSSYMSRQTKDCTAESRWGEQPRFENGTLYLLGRESAGHWPRVVELSRSAACVDAGYAFVCSRDDLTRVPAIPGQQGPQQLTVTPAFVQVCRGHGQGTTTLRWRKPLGINHVELRTRSPSGPVVHLSKYAGELPNIAVTGGTTFYLMDSTGGLSEDRALGKAVAYLTTSGCDDGS